MIALARLVDAPAREVRKRYEEQVEEPQRQAYARLANARFRLLGTDTYPDATFTLRLAFGVVKGYTTSWGKRSRPGPRSPARTSGPTSTTTCRRSRCPSPGWTAKTA